MVGRVCVAVALAVIVTGASASDLCAESKRSGPPGGWSYLIDDGAVPFFWAPLGLAVGLRLFAAPPDSPRGFSADEGGEPFSGDTVPNAVVGAYAFAGAGLLAVLPGRARWIHAKGFAEAAMTTAALTELAKLTFGRHRPHYTDNTVAEERLSFFSGHASVTFATTTYVSLYLNRHVFSRWRPPSRALAWWELVPYGVLVGGSAWVVQTRLDDNRHHKSDVITGALVGTATAGLFFWWQEARYKRSRMQLVVTPRQVGFRAAF